MVFDTKYQDGTFSKIELTNVNKWFISSSATCIVTNNYGLYDTNGMSFSSSLLYSVTLHESNYSLVYTTHNNFHITVILKAMTIGNVAKSINMRFDVCGQETINLTQSVPYFFVVPMMQNCKNCTQILVANVGTWFFTSDDFCPTLRYELHENPSLGVPRAANVKDGLTPTNSLWIFAQSPRLVKLQVKAYTKYINSKFMEFAYRVCGDE